MTVKTKPNIISIFYIKNLLIGNGFSISYSPSIFSYNALSSFINSSDDSELKTLFSVINTSNFE